MDNYQTENSDYFKQYVVEDPYIAIMVVDTRCRLVYCNSTYLHVMSFKKEEILGRYIEDIVPLTKAPDVIRTGKPERAYLMPLNGQNTIACCYPIIKDGEMIGAIGRSLFLDMDYAHAVADMVNRLEADVESFQQKELRYQQQNHGFDRLIGQHPAFKRVEHVGKCIATTDSTVLITGETGTGKDLFAKAIHLSSTRKQGPFIRVNCAAIPDQLLESELFGYEEGTFTGALKGGKKGKFELANRGTIFLDEIGEMPLSMQAKLLVVLQEREIQPLGSQLQRPKKIDARIIAATNQDLEIMIAEGKFRQDLYYRLNVINIELPSLKHRKSDIVLLSNAIIKKLCQRMEIKELSIDPEVIRSFQDYDWPGNIRELENIIERSIVRATIAGESSIQNEHIGELLHKPVAASLAVSSPGDAMDLKDYMQAQEKLMLEEVLIKSNGDKYLASKMLNIHISALYKKLNKYGLNKKIML